MALSPEQKKINNAAAAKRFYHAHKDKLAEQRNSEEYKSRKKAYDEKYYTNEAVIERRKLQSVEYRNRPEIKKRMEEYASEYLSNPITYAKRSKSIANYRKANPDRMQVWNQNRRARKEGAGGKLTHDEWEAIKLGQDYKCLACGIADSVRRLTIDHIVSLFNGGSNDAFNIQGLCGLCNSSKGTKDIDYRGNTHAV